MDEKLYIAQIRNKFSVEKEREMETCESYIDEAVFLRVIPIIQHCDHKKSCIINEPETKH